MSTRAEPAAPLPAASRPLRLDRLRITERVGLRQLVLAGVLLLLPAFFIKSNSDPDYWWHLRDGQWIVSHLGLPTRDLYTFTASTHAWTDHEYLSEALMWLLYQAGGTIAVGVALGAITWLGFVLIYRTSSVARRPVLIVGAGLLLGALAGAAIWSPRAQMITFFFACLELYWLRRFLEGRGRGVYALPLVMIVWANLHGGWAVAFVFLGVALAAEALGWWLDRSSPEHLGRLKRLAIVTAATAVAVGATPHGAALYGYPFSTQGSGAQQNLIIEWLSPNFHQLAMRPFEAMVLLLFVGLALRRPTAYDLLLSVATLFMALQSVRHVVIFVAATTPILIATWSDIWVRYRDVLPIRRVTIPRSAFLTTVTVTLLLGTVAGVGQHIAADVLNQAQVTAGSYPVAAADWMAAHPDQLGTRMFNQYGWGGYLAYRFYPERDRRVFVFGEAELMGDALMYDYQHVQDVTPKWDSILRRYGVDYVVFNAGSPLDVLLGSRTDWRQVYRDDVAVIYVRKS